MSFSSIKLCAIIDCDRSDELVLLILAHSWNVWNNRINVEVRFADNLYVFVLLHYIHADFTVDIIPPNNLGPSFSGLTPSAVSWKLRSKGKRNQEVCHDFVLSILRISGETRGLNQQKNFLKLLTLKAGCRSKCTAADRSTDKPGKMLWVPNPLRSNMLRASIRVSTSKLLFGARVVTFASPNLSEDKWSWWEVLLEPKTILMPVSSSQKTLGSWKNETKKTRSIGRRAFDHRERFINNGTYFFG